MQSRDRRPDWQYRADDWLMVVFVPLSLAALFVMAYADAAFPFWPQDLGGARPRAAVLDVVRGDLSPEGQANLLPDAGRGTAAVVRTRPVFVYFRSDQRLLVKTYPSPTSQTYEIEGSSVKGAVWFDRGAALSTLLPRPKPAPPRNTSIPPHGT